MKKIAIFSILILIIIFISGAGCEKEQLCKQPYFEYKTGECCLDSNNNQVCDNDEKGTDREEIIVSGTQEKDAEKVALQFANSWEKGNYEELYEFFTPELKSKKSKYEFNRILNRSRIIEETPVIRLDNTKIMSNDKALAYYHVTGFLGFPAEMPALEMRLIDGNWKFDAFGHFFDAECIYDYECPYTNKEKLECESEDVTKFSQPYCSQETLKCSVNCADALSFRTFCSTNFAGEKEENRKVICNNLLESQYKLNIKFNEDTNSNLIFKNYEGKQLTNVKIIVNKEYIINKGTMGIEEEYIIDKTTLLSKDGRGLRAGATISSIYLYSSEGKWITGISWEALEKPSMLV